MNEIAFLIFVIGIIWILINNINKNIRKRKAKREKEIDNELKVFDTENFNPTDKIIGPDGNGLAIDSDKNEICLIKKELVKIKPGEKENKSLPDFWGDIEKNENAYKYTYKTTYNIRSSRDIISAELFEDGNAVTRSSRSNQIGRMAIGGLILGGVGVLIGGLSSERKSTNKVNIISLRITINSLEAPLHDIDFLKTETTKGGVYYNSVMQKARYWQGLLDVLIRRADEEDRLVHGKVLQESLQSTKHNSITDELIKLSDLKNKGVLSEDEFNHQKQKLLLNG